MNLDTAMRKIYSTKLHINNLTQTGGPAQGILWFAWKGLTIRADVSKK